MRSSAITYSQAIAKATSQEMERDPSVFLFGLDVDDHKRIQSSTEGLVEKFGADRCFGTPLSEDAMTGVAIGMAMAGLRPIHVHIRMDFMMLAMNQLINIAAKANYMWGTKIPMVIRTMVGRSWGQGAQHSQALHSMFMHVPGIKICAPSNAHDAKGCLIEGIRDDNPVIIMEHRLLYNKYARVPEESYVCPQGKGRVVQSGDHITIIGISHMIEECKKASEHLKKFRIQAEIIDPIWLKPLDISLIVMSVAKTGNLLIVDNGWTTCGIGAEIMAQITERLPGDNIRMKRMGFAECPCPTTKSLENLFYPNTEEIARTAFKMVVGDSLNETLEIEREKPSEIRGF